MLSLSSAAPTPASSSLSSLIVTSSSSSSSSSSLIVTSSSSLIVTSSSSLIVTSSSPSSSSSSSSSSYCTDIQLRTLLARGEVTKDMVKDIEKAMGVDLNQMGKLLNSPAAMKNMKAADPEIANMVDLFKKLIKIKNS
jgi:hypothetical protein